MLQLKPFEDISGLDAGRLKANGTLTHRDDQKNIEKIHAGAVHVMSAGTGIPSLRAE